MIQSLSRLAGSPLEAPAESHGGTR
jgi:hypothetical protein